MASPGPWGLVCLGGSLLGSLSLLPLLGRVSACLTCHSGEVWEGSCARSGAARLRPRVRGGIRQPREPPIAGKVVCADGKKLELGEEQYLNRLQESKEFIGRWHGWARGCRRKSRTTVAIDLMILPAIPRWRVLKTLSVLAARKK